MQGISAHSEAKTSFLWYLLPQADNTRKLSQEFEQVKKKNARLAKLDAESSATIVGLKGKLVEQVGALAESERIKDDLQKAHDALTIELKGILNACKQR